MSDSTIAIYAAIFAGFSALAGIGAAVAAWRSANTAKVAVESQSEEEHRRLALELAKIGQEILSKANSIHRLCEELKNQYNSLAIFTGGMGGSRHKIFTDRIKEYKKQLATIVDEVQEAHLSGEVIDEMSEKRIGELLITYTMKREEIFELYFVISGEKSELQAELEIYQSKAINDH